jgi:formamidopyrimidine-DNA glycosylase
MEQLGPDPLAIDCEAFISRLRARRAMVKPLLLNQGFLRGMGNIYTDEALFRAGIHPRALATRLSRARAAGLHAAIREVLLESKEGEPCPACSSAIRRILVAQRGTHLCPKCQKR